ncbi:hypothetical protein ACQP3F_30680, partial [Escherichia coli]
YKLESIIYLYLNIVRNICTMGETQVHFYTALYFFLQQRQSLSEQRYLDSGTPCLSKQFANTKSVIMSGQQGS